MADAFARSRIAAELKRRLEDRPEIVFAYLHGSFTSPGPYRDVDVAVWVDPAREPDHGTRYALDLALWLERGLGPRVDVQALNDAPLAFRYHALAGRLLFTRDDEFLDELRARTWDEYFDFEPFARQYLRDALGE
jgi:predicted nucleotidyltransferase